MAVVRPFPVGGAVRPESRQIGRRPAIDGLERQVVERRQHTLLIGQRRIGKSSMVLAVLDRLRNADHGWALEVDISRGPIRDAAALADRIAEQARAAGVRIDRPGDLAASVDQALAPVGEAGEEPLDPRTVLLAIQAAATAEKRITVIFFDEIQRVASREDWSDPEDSLDVQTVIAELMEAPEGAVVVVLAGSDGEAIERLLAKGQPLHHDGMSFAVPEISADDWRHGLRERFSELAIAIGDAYIDRILEASGGHPQRTMRVCAHVHQLSGPGYDISDALIDEAIKDARKHPSWPS